MFEINRNAFRGLLFTLGLCLIHVFLVLLRGFLLISGAFWRATNSAFGDMGISFIDNLTIVKILLVDILLTRTLIFLATAFLREVNLEAIISSKSCARLLF